jgi:hypothetical protein
MKAPVPLETTTRVIHPDELIDLTPNEDGLRFPGAAAVERARQAVKAPAITLIAAGSISLFCNLFIAGFGYVDQFVTPLTTESRNKRAHLEIAGGTTPPFSPGMPGTTGGASDEQATVVLTILVLMTLSIAGAAAVWAGFGMLELRGYWLSVAGSFAIMPAGLFCCMAGVPIGIWSLSVLYRPEVASSFE